MPAGELKLDPAALVRGLTARSIIAACAINLISILSCWGEPRVMAELFGIAFFLSVVNIWFDRRGLEILGTVPAEVARTIINLIGAALACHLMRWNLVGWLWLPFSAAITDVRRTRWLQISFGLFLVVLPALGVLQGSPWQPPVLFVALALIIYALAEGRARIIEAMLAERERQNQELRRAHAELESAHALAVRQERLSSLGLLAAGVAHEINNPMAFVTSNLNGLLEDLKRAGDLPEILAEYRDEVVPATIDGARRVNAIVADLRRFARGDPEALVEFDLETEVRSACRIANSRFRGDCKLEVQIEELPALIGRPQQLSQVLVNLLVNAAQAVKGPGLVKLSCRREGDGIELSVADDGVGMDAETQRRLFEPFFTTKPVGEGTGLGLAVIHGIVKAHGGTISVESAPGQGSRFTIWIPRRAPVSTPAEPMPALRLDAVPQPRPRSRGAPIAPRLQAAR